MRNPLKDRSMIEIAWYVLGAYVVLLYLEGPVAAAVSGFEGWASVLALLRVLAGLALVVFVFLLPPAAFRRMKGKLVPPAGAPSGQAPGGKPTPSGPHAFPSDITYMVGTWLLVFTFASFVGLIISVRQPAWLDWLFSATNDQENVAAALVTTFAAGIGAAVTAILGYLKHASELKDFDEAYMPWFVARPVLGMLLGLIFYFVVKGGLLATMPGEGDAELNLWAMAGIGALVGLFSKNAIEKLRELFNTLFNTEKGWGDDLKGRIEKADPQLWERVAPFVHLEGE